MKILIGILIVLVLISMVILIAFNSTTSFINDIYIEEPIDGNSEGYTMPSMIY